MSQTVQPTPWNVHFFGIKERMKGKPGYARAAKMGDGSAALCHLHREELRVHSGKLIL